MKEKKHSLIKNPIIDSLKNSLRQIRMYKLRFTMIFMIQSVFFILITTALYNTVVPASENLENIYNYTSNLDLDDLSIAKTMLSNESFLPDTDMITNEYQVIEKLFSLFIVFFILIFIIVNGTLWYFTSLFFKKPLNYNKYILTFGLVSILNFILVYLLVIPRIAFTLESFTFSVLIFPILILLIIQYLFFIAISHIINVPLKSIVKKTFTVGIKKMQWILLANFINLVLFVISFLFLVYFAERNFIIGFLSSILFIFVFCFKRLFFMNVIEKSDL